MSRIGLTAAIVVLALFGAAHAARRERVDAESWFFKTWLLPRDGNKWTPPAFCHNKDCPEFSIKETADDVELREYVPAHWINTNVTDAKFDDAWKEGTKRLDAYRDGGNKQGAKVDATVPTFVLLYPAPTGRTFSSQFTVEYFVPFELQDAPPEPSATDVAIMKVPVQQVWVKTFGGFADESSVTKEAFDFLDNLTKQGKKVSRAFVGFAQYDPITTLINRHNEIWVWVEQQPSA